MNYMTHSIAFFPKEEGGLDNERIIEDNVKKGPANTDAIKSILQSVDKKMRLKLRYIFSNDSSIETKIKFMIDINQTPSFLDDKEETQVYEHFAKELKILLNATAMCHEMYIRGEFSDAIELNKQYDGKLEKLARLLYKIERDLELIFHTDSANQIETIKASKLTKLDSFKELVDHEEKSILIDEYAKHNSTGKKTFSIKESTGKVIGNGVTCREELLQIAENAYNQSLPVDITVLNPDKVAAKKVKLTGEIIKIELNPTLLNTAAGE